MQTIWWATHLIQGTAAFVICMRNSFPTTSISDTSKETSQSKKKTKPKKDKGKAKYTKYSVISRASEVNSALTDTLHFLGLGLFALVGVFFWGGDKLFLFVVFLKKFQLFLKFDVNASEPSLPCSAAEMKNTIR